ncbi:MAG: LemA family protein [Pseudomonadota bacterium]
MEHWIVLAVVAALVVWAIVIYNGLINLNARVKQSFADIDVQLKQRHDLIPNLVATVKGYATHEASTLEAVIKARQGAVAANTPGEQAAAENMLTATLGKLFMLQEAYPNLKANENFKMLQMEIGDIENKVAAARRFFNNTVTEYNATLQAFPSVLVARLFGFEDAEFFDVGEEKRQTLDVSPQVQFS